MALQRSRRDLRVDFFRGLALWWIFTDHVPGDVLEAAPRQGLSLHEFRWDHALYAGRRIYGAGFPAAIRVFLIEAKSLDLSIGLSPPVRDAAGRVCDRVAALAHAFASGGWA